MWPRQRLPLLHSCDVAYQDTYMCVYVTMHAGRSGAITTGTHSKPITGR